MPDYGQPDGGSAISEWSACTAAHNTVLVDGACQRHAPGGDLQSARQGSYLDYAQAAAPGLSEGVDHTRRLVLLDGVCVVVDTLTGQSEHDYDWLIHCDGEVRVARNHAEAHMEWAGHPMVSIERAYDAGGGCRVDWACGNGRLALAVWPQSGQGILGVGTSPADIMSRRASIVVCRQRARDAEFVAALAPSTSGKVELTREGREIAVERRGCADHIYVSCREAESAAQRLFTDGEVAAVRTRDGEIESVAVIRGSWVRWDGETLLECPGSVECAEVCFGGRNPMITYLGDTTGVVKIKTTARAMRVNGHRTGATTSDGQALLRITPQMLVASGADLDV
jgi:hypothetical protein